MLIANQQSQINNENPFKGMSMQGLTHPCVMNHSSVQEGVNRLHREDDAMMIGLPPPPETTEDMEIPSNTTKATNTSEKSVRQVHR